MYLQHYRYSLSGFPIPGILTEENGIAIEKCIKNHDNIMSSKSLHELSGDN
jgi:hypothetical protein